MYYLTGSQTNHSCPICLITTNDYRPIWIQLIAFTARASYRSWSSEKKRESKETKVIITHLLALVW